MFRKAICLGVVYVIMGLAVGSAVGEIITYNFTNETVEEGRAYWDIPENWDRGEVPFRQPGDEIRCALGPDEAFIVVDDYDSNNIKEGNLTFTWNVSGVTLFITSFEENGDGGILDVDDLLLCGDGGVNNRVIVDQGILNADTIRTTQSDSLLATAFIEVLEGGTVNSDQVQLTQSASDPCSLAVLTINGGEMNVSGPLSTAGTPGQSRLYLNGGQLLCGSLAVQDDFIMDVNGGTLLIAEDQSDLIARLTAAGQVTVGGISGTRGGVTVAYDAEADTTSVTGDPSTINYDQAWNPAPVGSGIAHDLARLTWDAGENTAATQGHDVYLGTDANAVADANVENPMGVYVDRVSSTELSLSTSLELGKTFYWRVDQINKATEVIVKGNVWQFKVTESILVDDFETYTDDEPNEIWRTWIDGVDVDENGSQAGHDFAPYAEQLDVWQADQAMPLYYNNVDDVTNSEVKRTFETPQDWTDYGIKSLSLFFSGDSNNTFGTVYVKINETKIPYDLSSEHFRQLWQPWIVNLTEVDTSVLENVTSLAIGIDGAGSGHLTIDNIRLYGKEGETMTAEAPNAANLIAHYKLDGDFQDSSGNGYHGTHSGTTNWVDGGDGFGTVWDALNNQGLECGTFDPAGGTDSFTMSTWLKFSGNGAIQHFLTKSNAYAVDQMMFQIEIKANNPAPERSGRFNLVPHWQTGPEHDLHIVPVGEWSHNIVTFDGEMAQSYLDGTPGFKPVSFAMGDARDANVIIGNAFAPYLDRHMQGLMSDFRIYKSSISKAEAMSLAGRTDEVYKPFD